MTASHCTTCRDAPSVFSHRLPRCSHPEISATRTRASTFCLALEVLTILLAKTVDVVLDVFKPAGTRKGRCEMKAHSDLCLAEFVAQRRMCKLVAQTLERRGVLLDHHLRLAQFSCIFGRVLPQVLQKVVRVQCCNYVFVAVPNGRGATRNNLIVCGTKCVLNQHDNTSDVVRVVQLPGKIECKRRAVSLVYFTLRLLLLVWTLLASSTRRFSCNHRLKGAINVRQKRRKSKTESDTKKTSLYTLALKRQEHPDWCVVTMRGKKRDLLQ